ncbi:MAG: archaetidylinositol phosphate synthase [Candidatus Bathyarchaeia archaeon]
MLTRLKERVQSMLTVEAELLHRAGLTPNQVSGLGILLAFAAGCFYWAWQVNRLFLVIAPVLFLLSGLCDALDGIIARLHGETTVFGGFLDSILDRYADAFILVALTASGLCDVFWGSAALVGSLLVSYARARAEAAGAKMETIGLAERAERMVILTAASFAAFFWLEALNWSVIVLAVLTNLTVLQRAIYFYKATRQKEG